MKTLNKISFLIFMAACFFCTTAHAQDTDSQDTGENISKKEKQEVINAVGKLMQDKYVFPEVGKKNVSTIEKEPAEG